MTVCGRKLEIRGWVAFALTAAGMLAALSAQYGVIMARMNSMQVQLDKLILEKDVYHTRALVLERRLSYCEGWIASEMEKR